jgi:hypothetical protein
MRRLLLVLVVLGIAGVAVYRRRSIEQWEQTMHIGRHRDGDRPAPPAPA